MKLIKFISVAVLAFLSMTVSAEGDVIDPDNLFPKVKFETSEGDVIVELDRIAAPLTVNHFLTLVVKGDYNNTIFHRIVPEFIVQGGGYDSEYLAKDPGPTIVNESGNGLKNETGTIAMARENRPHSATRQFFFNVNDNDNLDPGRGWGYTVFGSITEGEEIIQQMAKAETDFSEELGWEDVPVKKIMLKKVTLLPAE